MNCHGNRYFATLRPLVSGTQDQSTYPRGCLANVYESYFRGFRRPSALLKKNATRQIIKSINLLIEIEFILKEKKIKQTNYYFEPQLSALSQILQRTNYLVKLLQSCANKHFEPKNLQFSKP